MCQQCANLQHVSKNCKHVSKMRKNVLKMCKFHRPAGQRIPDNPENPKIIFGFSGILWDSPTSLGSPWGSLECPHVTWAFLNSLRWKVPWDIPWDPLDGIFMESPGTFPGIPWDKICCRWKFSNLGMLRIPIFHKRNIFVSCTSCQWRILWGLGLVWCL